jgi:hypothetical protein
MLRSGVEEEVMRVLHTQRNFYMVLKVTRSTPKRDIKLNYHTIIKLLGEAAAGELEGITEARSIVHHVSRLSGLTGSALTLLFVIVVSFKPFFSRAMCTCL